MTYIVRPVADVGARLKNNRVRPWQDCDGPEEAQAAKVAMEAEYQEPCLIYLLVAQ